MEKDFVLKKARNFLYYNLYVTFVRLGTIGPTKRERIETARVEVEMKQIQVWNSIYD